MHVGMLLAEAAGVRSGPSLFPDAGFVLATLMWWLYIAAIVIGVPWYLWRVLRGLERIAEGLNKPR